MFFHAKREGKLLFQTEHGACLLKEARGKMEPSSKEGNSLETPPYSEILHF
jgi:hypothetical protein